MILRACSVCGTPSPTSRCAKHPRPKARRNQKLRAQVAASTTTCPNCGDTASPANPMTADHRLAQAHGGQDSVSNLRPLCRRCNSRAGQALNA